MNAVNRTLYIPLYGKAYVSSRGIILHDPHAEEVWQKEGFAIRGKAHSKWLAYYMAMRAAVVDEWVQKQLTEHEDTVVLHLGCGLDSRCRRINAQWRCWYDVDLPDVVAVRRRYFEETIQYRMLDGDVLEADWLERIPEAQHAVVVMEGLSMYLPVERLQLLFKRLREHFPHVELIMDAYTERAVRLSRRGNPIRTVGADCITGLDDPHRLTALSFWEELCMTPETKICELPQRERWLFRTLYAGRFAKSLYRIYTYCS